MTHPTLTPSAIRNCFDGFTPGMIATCAPDGTPNVSYLSEVEYVDEAHVALSFQFFNKTRANILANPHANLTLWCPSTAAEFELRVEYLRTEDHGPLFQAMKARLAGIAALTGMTSVFKLRGADVYRVHAIERIPGSLYASPNRPRNHAMAQRSIGERIARAIDLASLGDETLCAIHRHLGHEHAMLFAADNRNERLYLLASHGFAASGVGSELSFGDGIIGIAARERVPIRIAYSTQEYNYNRFISRQIAGDNDAAPNNSTDIAVPKLADIRSQLAVPIVLGDRLIGVLAVQSADNGRFAGEDEDSLAAVATQFALALRGLDAVAHEVADSSSLSESSAVLAPPPPAVTGPPIRVRYFAEGDSVFLDDDYLIKGVAGAIFWKLARDFKAGRADFSNRELRLSPEIRLPELSENLEARLVLLTRRLAERGGAVRIEKTGRGRFRLAVDRPLELVAA